MTSAVGGCDIWGGGNSSQTVRLGASDTPTDVAGDYPVYIRELIASPTSVYEVLELLGRGTFGQVLKCWKKDSNEVVALKILKNVPSYSKQGQVEIGVLTRLKKSGSEDIDNFVFTHESFIHRGHICIVFEMLHMNLYDYLKQNGFQSLPLKHIRPIAQQVLCCLAKLRELGLVHADLKPENIMLVDHVRQPFRVKVIDFGSATGNTQTNTTAYIQSRYYRAPEIIMGMPYTESIDMWSFACVLAELFLGWPLFPGSSEYDQILYICQMLGLPPDHLFGNVAKASRFFVKNNHTGPWTLKPQTQYQIETGVISQETRKYVFTSVTGIGQASNNDVLKSTEERLINQLDCVQFISLLSTLLTFDPIKRASPVSCLNHPYITMHHLTVYSNCVSVRELIPFMQVCRQSHPNQPILQPSQHVNYTLPPSTLAYFPFTCSLLPSMSWHGNRSTIVDVGYESADPSPPAIVSSADIFGPSSSGKCFTGFSPHTTLSQSYARNIIQPPNMHSSVFPSSLGPQGYSYDQLYCMLPQYWLANNH